LTQEKIAVRIQPGSALIDCAGDASDTINGLGMNSVNLPQEDHSASDQKVPANHAARELLWGGRWSPGRCIGNQHKNPRTRKFQMIHDRRVHA
jgi:hypothetical protein